MSNVFQIPNRLIVQSAFPEHPYHPPKQEGNPWDIEFLPDNGYKVKIVQGVYQVYKSQEDLLSRAKKPIPYEVRAVS